MRNELEMYKNSYFILNPLLDDEFRQTIITTISHLHDKPELSALIEANIPNLRTTTYKDNYKSESILGEKCFKEKDVKKLLYYFYKYRNIMHIPIYFVEIKNNQQEYEVLKYFVEPSNIFQLSLEGKVRNFAKVDVDNSVFNLHTLLPQGISKLYNKYFGNRNNMPTEIQISQYVYLLELDKLPIKIRRKIITGKVNIICCVKKDSNIKLKGEYNENRY